MKYGHSSHHKECDDRGVDRGVASNARLVRHISKLMQGRARRWGQGWGERKRLATHTGS